jgi:hypothetical protein
MTDDMMQAAMTIWAAKDLPARLLAAQVAKLLNCTPEDVAILVSAGKLRALGRPRPTKALRKHFDFLPFCSRTKIPQHTMPESVAGFLFRGKSLDDGKNLIGVQSRFQKRFSVGGSFFRIPFPVRFANHVPINAVTFVMRFVKWN